MSLTWWKGVTLLVMIKVRSGFITETLERVLVLIVGIWAEGVELRSERFSGC